MASKSSIKKSEIVLEDNKCCRCQFLSVNGLKRTFKYAKGDTKKFIAFKSKCIHSKENKWALLDIIFLVLRNYEYV